MMPRQSIFFLVHLFLISQLAFSQNDYLKMDTSIYAGNIGRLPKVKDEWKPFIQENSVPLKSIESDDFTDLMFLKDILQHKQYVFLGESSHIVEEFNKTKVRLIKFLHQEMGFDVISFESNLWDCHNINLQKDSLYPKQMFTNSIYGVWHTTSLLKLMEYLKRRNVSLSGFDIKESGLPDYQFENSELNALSPSVAEIAKQVLTGYYAYRKKMAQSGFYMPGKKNNNDLTDLGNKIIVNLKMLNDSLVKLTKENPSNKNLLIYQKDIENKTVYTGCLLEERKLNDNISNVRDSMMAVTLEWLVKEIYPGKKIVFWGHNTHISKYHAKGDIQHMGFRLNDSIKDKSYVIGLYMYRGETYTDKTIQIGKPKKNSLEAILIQPRYKYSFFDFSMQAESLGSSWIFQAIPAMLWGMTLEKIIPGQAYDGVIFIDKVTKPEYLFDYYREE